MQVEVTFSGEWSYGLIQRAYQGDASAVARLHTAYYEIVTELRNGHPSIWLMGSDHDPNAFTLEYPPLVAHFRKVHDSKVAIFAFEEQH